MSHFSIEVAVCNQRGNDLMKKYITILTLLLLPVLALGGAQQIEPQISPNVADSHGIVDETPNSWFVELSSKPASEGTSKRALKNEKAAFRSAARKAGLQYSERFAFDTLFNGEEGAEEVITNRVFARPEDMPNCVAYQLSDSHFVIITPDPAQPYILCENGQHGVLFQQGQLETISHTAIESEIEYYLHDKEILWSKALEGFNYTPSSSIDTHAVGPDLDKLHEEGRKLATLLYYLSPWFDFLGIIT